MGTTLKLPQRFLGLRKGIPELSVRVHQRTSVTTSTPPLSNPQTVIAAKKRRLEKLEERQTIMGISTPPEVANEIEDLRREIGELEG
jgi:hypothetical protein